MRNNVNFLHVCFIRYSIIQESWNPLTPFWKSKDILVWNWSLQTSEYYISIKGLVVVLAWYLRCSAKMMMPHIFYIYHLLHTEMFCQYLLSTYLHRIIFFLYCNCFVSWLNIWPDSLDAGGSACVDDEAPAEVLLDGVEPPELARHDDEDGGHVDQHQPLHTLLQGDRRDRGTPDTHQDEHQPDTRALLKTIIHPLLWF